MPAKDFYHDHVRIALEKDGWTITHDPYFLMIGKHKAYVDIGAERGLIGAKKGKKKIAIEIKSFIGASDIYQFEDAFGQFLIYLVALKNKEPERELYLAVPLSFFNRFFDDLFFLEITSQYNVKMIIFDEIEQKIVLWKN